MEESIQRLQNRLKQYKSTVQRSNLNHSGVFQHCLDLGNGTHWKNTKIVTSNQVCFKGRIFSEAPNLATEIADQQYADQQYKNSFCGAFLLNSNE